MADIEKPIYILNGVQSNRWIKPVIENTYGNIGNNSFSCTADLCLKGQCPTNYCTTTGCPSITRAFYSLVEDGSVYLTTPDGLVFYLANNSDKMKLVFPINKLEEVGDKNMPIESTGFMSVSPGIGSGKIQVGMGAASYDLVVTPALTHVIPWRPGTTDCYISYGENYRDRRLQYTTRESMSFPYANGYYCVQTDYNRCVLFYKGELIYDGEFNGMGLPMSFSYGLMTCISYGMGCCPKVQESSIKWNYRVMPKWKIDENAKQLEYVTESAVDRFLATHQILNCGIVVGSNIFKWNKNKSEFETVDGYYADDSYQKIVEMVDEEYEVTERDSAGMPLRNEDGSIKKTKKNKKVAKEQDVPDGVRRFDIYLILPGTKQGISPFPLCYFFVPSENGTFLKGQLMLSENIEQAKKNDVFDAINALLLSIEGIGNGKYEILEGFKNIVSDKNSIKSILNKIKNLDALKGILPNLNFSNIKDFASKLQQAMEAGEEVLAMMESLKESAKKSKNEISALSSELMKLFNLVLSEKDVRIWWSPVLGADSKNENSNDPEDKVYCGLNEEEKVSIPVYGSESDIVFRCDERLHTKTCNPEYEKGMPPKYLEWYAGKGYTEEDGQRYSNGELKPGVLKNRTLWLSRWRNELCTYCEEGENEDRTPKCKCSDVTVTSNPYTKNNNCKWKSSSYDSKENGPGVCGKCSYPVDFGSEDEPCWRHAPDVKTEENGKRHCARTTIDYETGEPITQEGKLTYYCESAVAKVSLDYLGGRVETVGDSDWGFIRIGAPKCRIKKDYTIVGQINSPLELPGITGEMVTTNEPEQDEDCNDKHDEDGNIIYKKVKQYKTVDASAANAVILRAPADVLGDFKKERTYGFAKGHVKTVKRYRKKKTEKVEVKRYYEVSGSDYTRGEGEDTVYYYQHIQPGCKSCCHEEAKDVGSKTISYAAGSSSNLVKVDAETQTTFSASTKVIKYECTDCDKTTGQAAYAYKLVPNKKFIVKDANCNNTISPSDPCYRQTVDYGEKHYYCFLAEVKEDGIYALPDKVVVDGKETTREVVHALNIVNAFSVPAWFKNGASSSGSSEEDIDIEDVFSSLVLYDADADFKFEFAGDWDYRTDLIDEKITVNKEFNSNIDLNNNEETSEEDSENNNENNNDNNNGNSGSSDTIVCTGIVTIVHSYKIVVDPDDEQEDEQPNDNSNEEEEEKEEIYETHTDTYTIIRQLHHKVESDKSDSYYVNEFPERTLSSRITHGVKLTDSELAEIVETGLGSLCKKLSEFKQKHQDKTSLISQFTGSILKVLNVDDLCTAFGDTGAFEEEDTDAPVDPPEVRGEFMRFYPAYLTHPDLILVNNDGVKARLMHWHSPYTKEHCFANDIIPTTSSKRTCEKWRDTVNVSSTEDFYNMDRYDSYINGAGTVNRCNIPEMISMNWSFMGIVNDLDILEEQIKKDNKQRENNKDDESDEGEKSYSLPSEIHWYVKWHDNNSTDTKDYVLIPLPKPEGKCDTSKIYKKIKNNKTLVYDDITIEEGKIKNNGTKTLDISAKQSGTWYCMGVFGNYDDALENYGGHEETDDETAYTDICGVKWIQAVTNWGDENGLAIRGGTKVGDVYFKLGELKHNENISGTGIIEQYIPTENDDDDLIDETEVHDIDEELNEFNRSKTVLEELDSDSDKYWYWNGFAWIEGKSYMSDLAAEEVIFYKDLGKLDIGIADSGESKLTIDDQEHTTTWGKNESRTLRGKHSGKCDKDLNCYDYSRAIFKGRVKPGGKQACGDVLAVNLNGGSEYHKAVFLEEKPIWDQPAYSAESYPDQQEYLRCLGASYTLLTYNIGKNKQMFRLWYRNYNKGEADSSTVEYQEIFNYEDVPDFRPGSAKDAKISLADINKYGANKVAKTYLVLLSRNKKKMYVFYKGRHLKTYTAPQKFRGSDGNFIDGGSWENTPAIMLAGVHGPKYCAIWKDEFTEKINFWFTGGKLGKFDLYRDGSLIKTVSGKVDLDGVIVEYVDYNNQNKFNEFAKIGKTDSDNRVASHIACRIIEFGGRTFSMFTELDLDDPVSNGSLFVLSDAKPTCNDDNKCYILGDGSISFETTSRDEFLTVPDDAPPSGKVKYVTVATFTNNSYTYIMYNTRTQHCVFKTFGLRFIYPKTTVKLREFEFDEGTRYYLQYDAPSCETSFENPAYDISVSLSSSNSQFFGYNAQELRDQDYISVYFRYKFINCNVWSQFSKREFQVECDFAVICLISWNAQSDDSGGNNGGFAGECIGFFVRYMGKTEMDWVLVDPTTLRGFAPNYMAPGTVYYEVSESYMRSHSTTIFPDYNVDRASLIGNGGTVNVCGIYTHYCDDTAVASGGNTDASYNRIPIREIDGELLLTFAVPSCESKDGKSLGSGCESSRKTYIISKSGIRTTGSTDFVSKLLPGQNGYQTPYIESVLCDQHKYSCGRYFAYDDGVGKNPVKIGFWTSDPIEGPTKHIGSSIDGGYSGVHTMDIYKCSKTYPISYSSSHATDITVYKEVYVSVDDSNYRRTLEENCKDIDATTEDIFETCCSKYRAKNEWGTTILGGDYVVLADGRAFYKTTQIFDASSKTGKDSITGKAFRETSVTEGENGARKTKYEISNVCCGRGALFNLTKIEYTQKRNKTGALQFTYRYGKKEPIFDSERHTYQCLFIEGKPVYPFTNGESDEPVWLKDKGYGLRCCGLDYYHLVAGGFSDSLDDIWEDEAVLTEETNSSETYILKLVRKDGKIGPRELANEDEAVVNEIGTRVFSHTEKRYVVLGNTTVEKNVTVRRVLEYPKSWKIVDKNIVFLDDYNYEHAEAYPQADTSVMRWSILGALKEEQVRYIPWKHNTSMENRESHVYYRTTHISADPRIEQVVCYRYENIHPNKETDTCEEERCKTHYSGSSYSDKYTFGEYHAIGAYAIFYDNPFYDAWSNYRSEHYYWTEKNESDSGVKDYAATDDPPDYYDFYYFETPAVQNVLGVRYADKGGGYEHDASKRILCDVDHEYLLQDNFNNEVMPCGFKKQDKSTDSNGVPTETYDSSVEGSSGIPKSKLTFTTMKGITQKAQRNVCMIVWSKDKCQTGSKFVKLKHNEDGSYEDITASTGNSNRHTAWYDKKFIDWHSEDRPYDEFWDGTADKGKLETCLNIPNGTEKKDWIARLRSDVIYINDYNAAGRWDRVSGDDPIDDWQRASANGAVPDGGLWTSAPEYHTVQDPDNLNLCPCGHDRLVVSGNNTLYVFNADGRTDYDVLTGEKRVYPIAVEDIQTMPSED